MTNIKIHGERVTQRENNLLVILKSMFRFNTQTTKMTVMTTMNYLNTMT